MKKINFIPTENKLALDDAASKKRKELKEALLKGKKVAVGITGKPAGPNEKSISFIPTENKLALDDAASKKRKELKEALLKGKKVAVGITGKPTGPNEKSISFIPTENKLAAIAHWYEKDPQLFTAEKTAMEQHFPQFRLERLDDGRLAWVGELNIGIWNNITWTVMAVYDNNHPQAVMGSSVRVYLVQPDIYDIIDHIGWRPTHLLADSEGDIYLCTAEASNIKTGKISTSAVSVILWAVKWLMAFELVMTGDLTKEQFNTHGVI